MENPIIFFDGVCRFCSAAVQFVIQRDPEKRYRFVPLQSKAGETLLQRFPELKNVDSILLVEDGQIYVYSTAILRITRHLRGIWRVLSLLMVIPRPIRDGVYRLFSKYRYRMFGKHETCMVPTPDIKERFLEGEDPLKWIENMENK